MEPQPQLPTVPAQRKKMTKQLTGKRDDTPLHSAARAGNLSVMREILTSTESRELTELLAKQNISGETALYVAAEYGYVDLVREIIYYYDFSDAQIKARNGFDAFHIAAKQGDLEVVRVLLEVHPEFAMTVDPSNATALHTAATQGHVEVVNFLLDTGSSTLAAIAKSNGKTALHSAARNGHLEVVRSLLAVEPGILLRTDNKGQTALHMAAKGQNLEVVEVLIGMNPGLKNMVDNKGNTALHIATRKGRTPIVKLLLGDDNMDTLAINKTAETALDTAEKMGQSEIVTILQQRGVQRAKSIKPQTPNPARELKQTVSDLKHEVHYQLEHTRQTRRRVQGIAKRLNKMHAEGLNNAINSTTVGAVLIATVAFAAIFSVPGLYVDDATDIPPGFSLGEALATPQVAFLIFLTFDSVGLFISLAIVVVQTSVVVIESKAKRKMMSIINKLMWFSCVLISVAFLAAAHIVVGKKKMWFANGVTIAGTVIMAATLGTMCFLVIKHRLEAAKMRNIQRASLINRSRSVRSQALVSDPEIIGDQFKRMYAI